ncbi:glycine-rich protein-like [Mizuhopecten yessoensis]|uniref:glycine-rich protein-like n=1 Tax=Mizuhopecten yessoensis TaxID=6573 RepID=UPI000B45C83B|nr:glycine-rich protein-like [Mizuhopecten yessoensis]
MKSVAATLIAAIFCLGLTACLADDFDDFGYQTMQYPQYSTGYVGGYSGYGKGMGHGYGGYGKGMGHGYGKGYGKGYGQSYTEETIIRAPMAPMPMPMPMPFPPAQQSTNGLFGTGTGNEEIGLLLFALFVLPILLNGGNGLLG